MLNARKWTALAVILGLQLILLSACGGGSGGSADQTLHDYLSAWSHGDWRAMRALVADPPPNFEHDHAEAFTVLGVSSAHFTAGVLRRSGSHTELASVDAQLALRGLGTWRARVTISVSSSGGRWLVNWSPSVIDPRLPRGGRIALIRVWPKRGEILGADHVPLTAEGQAVTVGIVGARVRDAGAVLAALRAAGAPSGEAESAMAQAHAHPAQFEPVFKISRARFEALRGAPGAENVYSVPGTSFQAADARRAITSQLGAHLVGTVGPITAEQLHQLGAPYDSSRVVGQSGLESADERRLAGTPATEVDALDGSGQRLATLTSFPGHRPESIQTTIDLRVQRAAEAALAGQRRHAAVVAIQPSTGNVLAVVSDPADQPFDQALQGAYPPGSTFKVLISAALLRSGLSPSSPASCPPTLAVDGQSFHNAEGDGPTQTLDEAFTESCNTSFIQLALQHLRPASLPAIAADFGLQRTPRLGVPAFAANVNAPRGKSALAAASIGQDTLTFSPLGMAMVAAAVAHGSTLAPRLVAGAADDHVAPHPLPASVLSGLRTMMAHVTQTGTAAGTGLPDGTYAKTGTAQYQQGGALKTDAWLMGYHDDIAFAVVVQDSGDLDGGPRDGPLIARFLSALGAAGTP